MSQMHLNALKSRHAELDAKIAQEERRPHPDDSLVAQLKRMKLRLKDEMAAGA
jgi:hypothetical protein